MEWIVTQGATVAEASERAFEALAVAKEDADVEVLAEPSQSLWGMRRWPARVRVRVRPVGPPPRLGETRRDGSRQNRRRARGTRSSGQRSQQRRGGSRGNSSQGSGSQGSGSSRRRQASSRGGARSK